MSGSMCVSVNHRPVPTGTLVMLEFSQPIGDQTDRGEYDLVISDGLHYALADLASAWIRNLRHDGLNHVSFTVPVGLQIKPAIVQVISVIAAFHGQEAADILPGEWAK